MSNVLGVLGGAEDLSSIRMLLGLKDTSSTLQLDTRYYAAQVLVAGINASDNVLSCCGAVVLFCARTRDRVDDAKNRWADVRGSLADDCVRLLVVDGGCGAVDVSELLAWAAGANIELVCEEVCDDGLTVAGRVTQALECVQWPVRQLCSAGGSPTQRYRASAAVGVATRTRKSLDIHDIDRIVESLLLDDDSGDNASDDTGEGDVDSDDV
jgi:hypothetical protein